MRRPPTATCVPRAKDSSGKRNKPSEMAWCIEYMWLRQGCQRCPLHLRCLTSRGGKQRYLWVPIEVELTNFSRRMAGKVDSARGRKIYPQRFAVAAPVFANIRTQKSLDRFSLRGKVKVNIQWLLYCMVHNIEKIVHYGLT